MDPDRDEPLHPIGVAAERAGMTPDLIRAWERRYGVVTPSRDEGGRRVYTTADVQRLRLLARATEAGRSISQVAGLAAGDLLQVVREDEAARRNAVPATELPADAPAMVASALTLVGDMDGPGLEALLLRAASLHGIPTLCVGVLAPLFRAIGERWHAGEMSSAQEHLASATVRSVLGRLLSALPVPLGAPALVVGTPAGDRHEIGALLVTATAAVEGWRVVYLGPDLPAEEIASAARRTGARCVALSTVYAAGPGQVADEIDRLRRTLPKAVTLLLGGAAAAQVDESLCSQAGILRLGDLEEFRRYLRLAGKG